MLYVPSIFGESLMDDWFNGFDDRFFGRKNEKTTDRLMKTDVKEVGDNYEVDMDLPGFAKEDIQLKLKEGVLTVLANKNTEKEEKDNETGKVIRKERYTGSLQRSFYVGEELNEEDIKAKYVNGVLSLTVPKRETKKQIPQEKFISIEG